MEERAGDIVSVFIENYIRPAISEIEGVEIASLRTIQLSWTDAEIVISGGSAVTTHRISAQVLC